MLIILSGVSGSGKDTIKDELMKKNKDIKTFSSYTTREKRFFETDGNPYYFIDKEEFKRMLDEGELYEYSEHHLNFYGTGKKVLDETYKNSTIVIKDVDVNGTKALKEILKDKYKLITIFLNISREEMEKRLINRADLKGEEDLNRRLARYDYEVSFLEIYDYVIDNIKIEDTVNIIKDIIEKEFKK